MNEPNIRIVRTTEEMQEYIWALNGRIISGEDVPDSEITTALIYQRDLNQHNLEKKATRKKKGTVTEPAKKINLEDL